MTTPQQPCVGAPLSAALADEIVLASQLLADLAYDLGSDEATLRRHMTSLQKIDQITQMLLGVADLLKAGGDDDGAYADISLDDMRRRIVMKVSS